MQRLCAPQSECIRSSPRPNTAVKTRYLKNLKTPRTPRTPRNPSTPTRNPSTPRKHRKERTSSKGKSDPAALRSPSPSQFGAARYRCCCGNMVPKNLRTPRKPSTPRKHSQGLASRTGISSTCTVIPAGRHMEPNGTAQHRTWLRETGW